MFYPDVIKIISSFVFCDIKSIVQFSGINAEFQNVALHNCDYAHFKRVFHHNYIACFKSKILKLIQPCIENKNWTKIIVMLFRMCEKTLMARDFEALYNNLSLVNKCFDNNTNLNYSVCIFGTINMEILEFFPYWSKCVSTLNENVDCSVLENNCIILLQHFFDKFVDVMMHLYFNSNTSVFLGISENNFPQTFDSSTNFCCLDNGHIPVIQVIGNMIEKISFQRNEIIAYFINYFTRFFGPDFEHTSQDDPFYKTCVTCILAILENFAIAKTTIQITAIINLLHFSWPNSVDVTSLLEKFGNYMINSEKTSSGEFVCVMVNVYDCLMTCGKIDAAKKYFDTYLNNKIAEKYIVKIIEYRSYDVTPILEKYKNSANFIKHYVKRMCALCHVNRDAEAIDIFQKYGSTWKKHHVASVVINTTLTICERALKICGFEAICKNTSSSTLSTIKFNSNPIVNLKWSQERSSEASRTYECCEQGHLFNKYKYNTKLHTADRVE